MQRKYGNVTIASECNVSSSHNCHINFWCDAGRFFWSDGYVMRGLKNGDCAPVDAPKYLLRDLDAKIAQAARDGRLKFFEYNRDGIKRYENLRYFHDEMLEWLKALDKDTTP